MSHNHPIGMTLSIDDCSDSIELFRIVTTRLQSTNLVTIRFAKHSILNSMTCLLVHPNHVSNGKICITRCIAIVFISDTVTHTVVLKQYLTSLF